MDKENPQAEQFEAHRPRLQAVAYRMLGSLSDAEDAVQEAWLRLSRSGTTSVENLGGWLTTVVARVCLDMLRSRQSRHEESLPPNPPESAAAAARVSNPAEEALLAESVGLAMLVTLETLAPAERLAFVLHDMFAIPFDDIAAIAGRTPAAARQLASRARRRVQGSPATAPADLAREREVVEAYLAASRAGDFERLIAILDPDAVLRADAAAIRRGAAAELHGAHAIATQAATRRARFAQAALVNGSVGILVAPRGHLLLAITLTLHNGKISSFNLIADPTHLRQLHLSVLPTQPTQDESNPDFG